MAKKLTCLSVILAVLINERVSCEDYLQQEEGKSIIEYNINIEGKEKKNYFGRSLRLAVDGFGVVAATFTITSCEKETTEDITPLGSVQAVQEHGALIPGKYIVVFKKDADFGLGDLDTYEWRQAKMRQAIQGILRGKGIPEDRIGHVYGAAIKGMAVGLTNPELQQLRNDPRVAYIEQDKVIKLAPPAGKRPKDGGGSAEPTLVLPHGVVQGWVVLLTGLH